MGVRFELIFVIGFTCQLRAALMSFFRNVSHSLILESAIDILAQRTSQKTFLIQHLFSIRLISNWTEWSRIQGVIVLVISNRPRASRSSNFEITRAITP